MDKMNCKTLDLIVLNCVWYMNLCVAIISVLLSLECTFL